MQKLTRELSIDVEKSDDELLTFSIASEKPYLRQNYWEILKIEQDSINWQRLTNDRCPFLADHDQEKIIGVVKNAYIKNKKLYVDVKFSESEKAQIIKKDIVDGIRKNTSVGYYIDEYETSTAEDGIEVITATKWTPFEASSVSVPADFTTGYQRSLNKDQNMDENKEKETVETEETAEETAEVVENVAETAQEQTETEKPAETKAEETKPAEDTPKAEETKAEEEKPAEAPVEEVNPDEEAIRVCGEIAGEEEMADEFIKEKRSLVEFKKAIKEKRSSKNVNKINNKEIKKMSEKFNLAKAIRNACSQYKADVSNDYETKVIAENKRNLGVEDCDILLTRNELNTRALGPGAGSAGALIATDYLPQEYTPVSRPHLTLEQTGYYSIPVNGNAVSFAVCTSGSTAAMYDLDGELTNGDMIFATKTLTPHKAGVCIPVPYSLILQARPEVSVIVQDDLLKALEQIRDEQILIGSGTSGEVTGIANTEGVNTLSAVASALYSWDGVLEMEKMIRYANEFGDLCFVMNSNDYKKYASTLKSKNNAFDSWILVDGKIKDYPVYVNNKLQDGQIILGDFTQLVVADFEGLKLKIDDITYIKKQAIQIVAIKAFDCVIRKPKAFCVSHLNS